MVSQLTVGKNSYVTLTEANTYLNDAVRTAAWLSVGGSDKRRALISAFRELEKQSWQGDKSDINVVDVATLNAAGSTYVAGDVLTVAGGTFGEAAQIRVLTVTAGAIVTFVLDRCGTYTVDPTPLIANPVSGGTGSGATFDLTIRDQTALQPRSGLTDCDSVAILLNTVAIGIEQAQMELAFELSQDTDLEGSGGEPNNLRRAKAGSAEVEFYRDSGRISASGGASTRFPPIVWEYIRCFISGASITTITPFVNGAGTVSSFEDPPNFNLGLS